MGIAPVEGKLPLAGDTRSGIDSVDNPAEDMAEVRSLSVAAQTVAYTPLPLRAVGDCSYSYVDLRWEAVRAPAGYPVEAVTSKMQISVQIKLNIIAQETLTRMKVF